MPFESAQSALFCPCFRKNVGKSGQKLSQVLVQSTSGIASHSERAYVVVVEHLSGVTSAGGHDLPVEYSRVTAEREERAPTARAVFQTIAHSRFSDSLLPCHMSTGPVSRCPIRPPEGACDRGVDGYVLRPPAFPPDVAPRALHGVHVRGVQPTGFRRAYAGQEYERGRAARNSVRRVIHDPAVLRALPQILAPSSRTTVHA